MNQHWLIILGATASVFAVIGTGAGARRMGLLTGEADRSLLKVGIDLLLPCLIFTVVADNRALDQPGNLLLAPAVGFGSLVLGLGVAMLVARLGGGVTGLRGGVQRRTFALAVGTYNYGFLPLPLVRVLFRDDALGVLFVHNVGVGLALWTIGVAVISGTLDRRVWRQMINPPSVAVVAAVACNLLHLTPRLDRASRLLYGVKDPSTNAGASWNSSARRRPSSRSTHRFSRTHPRHARHGSRSNSLSFKNAVSRPVCRRMYCTTRSVLLSGTGLPLTPRTWTAMRSRPWSVRWEVGRPAVPAGLTGDYTGTADSPHALLQPSRTE